MRMRSYNGITEIAQGIQGGGAGRWLGIHIADSVAAPEWSNFGLDLGLSQGRLPTLAHLTAVRLKVRGLGNADYRRLQARLYEAVPRAKKVAGRIDPDEQDRILTQCLVDTCLLDWDGLEGDDGKHLPFSREKAAELLSDPALRRLREAVAWAAMQVADQEASDRKAIVGN